MKKYVAVLGRQPLISVAELESLFGENVKIIARSDHAPWLAEFATERPVEIQKIGGTMKIAEPIDDSLADWLGRLPRMGKIVIGVSDFSRRTSAYQAQKEALKLKRILAQRGRSARVVPNKAAVLSNATSLHNHLFTPTHIELLKVDRKWFQVTKLSNIEHYAKRDQERPARDARVGMLPPKLAQILINFCGNLSDGNRVLDPFCGTGVVLQEALLMGNRAYGTDADERMVEYTKKNLEWLEKRRHLNPESAQYTVELGDATNYKWQAPIDAVAAETYLGPPMSQPPAEIKLRQAKQECKDIIMGFLKNLAGQIKVGTPVAIAVPAWLRPDGHYERLNLLDEIDNLRYNVYSFKNVEQNDLLYHREGQVVAREIIVLRKK